MVNPQINKMKINEAEWTARGVPTQLNSCNSPRWLNHLVSSKAAVNLGVLVCIDCSGTHRSLGVHVSVRDLKYWHDFETIENSKLNFGSMILNQDWMFVNLSLLGHDDMMLHTSKVIVLGSFGHVACANRCNFEITSAYCQRIVAFGICNLWNLWSE